MDYMYPSVFFAYFLFFLLTALTLFFLIRSRKHGYFGSDSEEAKYRMMNDECGAGWQPAGRLETGPRGGNQPPRSLPSCPTNAQHQGGSHER